MGRNHSNYKVQNSTKFSMNKAERLTEWDQGYIREKKKKKDTLEATNLISLHLGQ